MCRVGCPIRLGGTICILRIMPVPLSGWRMPMMCKAPGVFMSLVRCIWRMLRRFTIISLRPMCMWALIIVSAGGLIPAWAPETEDGFVGAPPPARTATVIGPRAGLLRTCMRHALGHRNRGHATGSTSAGGRNDDQGLHVDDEAQHIRLYFHGLAKAKPGQWTGVATSEDGIHFTARSELLGKFYFRRKFDPGPFS